MKPARYGPPDRYAPPPGAGMCLSVFVLARRGRKALVGSHAPHAKWDDWMPSWRHFSDEGRASARSGLLLPGAYLFEGEDPAAGARRVLRGMLRARGGTLSQRPQVYSAVSASDWYPGKTHWDVAFVYDARGVELPARPPAWWRALEWVGPREVRAREFGWNADLARALGIASRS